MADKAQKTETKMNNPQTAAQPVRDPNTDKITIERITKFAAFFVASNPHNHTGKSFKDWTAEDLKKIASEDLAILRDTIPDKGFTLTDQLLPTGMSRADFSRAILRESARRGTITEPYINQLFVTPEQRANIAVTRLDYVDPNAKPTQVLQPAGMVAVHDSALDIILNDTKYVRVQPDVATATGVNPNRAMTLVSDVLAYDFGYTAGSVAQFNDKTKDGSYVAPLHVKVTVERTPEQIQADFCPAMDKLFNEGHMDNRGAFSLGFIQARVDAASHFDPKAMDHVGVIAPCVPNQLTAAKTATR